MIPSIGKVSVILLDLHLVSQSSEEGLKIRFDSPVQLLSADGRSVCRLLMGVSCWQMNYVLGLLSSPLLCPGCIIICLDLGPRAGNNRTDPIVCC
jgi:hypothetical protein